MGVFFGGGHRSNFGSMLFITPPKTHMGASRNQTRVHRLEVQCFNHSAWFGRLASLHINCIAIVVHWPYTLWGIKKHTKNVFTITSVKLSPFRLNLADCFLKYKLLCPRGTQTCALAVANIKVNGNGKVILDTHPESDQHQN